MNFEITEKNGKKVYTLANGLKIVSELDGNAKSCSLGVWVGSGSRYETPETAGTSHFIEHMLFRGTHTRSSLDIAEQMDEIGGVLNAYTAKEYTCYYARALTEHAQMAFDIICDMLSDPRLDESDIELEKNVITEEIAMYEDSPEDLCSDVFYENIWAGNALGQNILGTRETVGAMTAGALRAHLEKFYVPERMVVSFCGNFDEAAMLALCDKYFSKKKNTNNPICVGGAEYKKNVVTVDKPFEQNQIMLGYPGVALNDESRYAVQLLSSILGASSSSKLFQRIREELGLVYSVDCANASHLNTGAFIICAGVSAKSEEKAIKEILKIVREFPETVTERELSRAKEQAVAGLIMSLESSSSRASRNGREQLLFSQLRDIEKVVENIRGVTLSEIVGAAQKMFDVNNISFCAVGKVGKEEHYRKILK